MNTDAAAAGQQECPEERDTTTAASVWRRNRPRRGLIFGGAWLVFLFVPVTSAFERHEGTAARIAIVALAVVFGAAYVPVFFIGWNPRYRRWAHADLAVLVVLTGLFCLAAGEIGLFPAVFIAAAGVTVLEPRAALVFALTLIAACLVLPLLMPGWESDFSSAFSVAMSSLASFGFAQLLRSNRELSEAQSRIAELAVNEERVRFSRDLHDILGHSLTVITVKAELAGKLVERDPGRAVTEITDIERLGREALADVRSTAAGYRGVGLAAELSRARGTLAAAGVGADLPNSIDQVPGDYRELFGWVAREGVTNVVRHSKARTCTVRLTPNSVEVVDDGVGPSDSTSDGTGSGLAGLRERVQSADGTFEIGRAPEGGFRLYVRVGR
ncbi:sensor histidine kinase [Flindersiella endophytica]